MSTEEAKKITQEAWVDAVIKTWAYDHLIVDALSIAAKYSGSYIRSNEEINVLIHEASKLRPRIDPHVMWSARIRPWIADNFMHANNALWDKKYDLAKKWLLSGKDVKRTKKMATIRREAKGANRAIKNLMVVKVRERDDHTKWNKTK